MDLQELQEYANQFDSMTCIMSVEKNPDGSYGKMRIEVGNKAYIASYEKDNSNPIDMPFCNKFVPGQEYTAYIPKDLNFEHFIFNSAVNKKPMHAYIHPDRFDVWFNIFSLPLEFDDPNKCYCTYTQEVSTEASVDQMANLSAKTTSDVLKTCIKLRSTKNFLQTMDEVISDIRVICGASFCCIMLTDFKENTCSLLSESCDPNVIPRTLLEYLNDSFTELVKTWVETIGGSNCLIIKNEKDMDFVRERNPEWYESLREADINSLLLFPLMSGCELLGYIWFSNYNTEDSVHLKETLELVSYFLASEISNYQLFDRLRIVSTMDMLTGVYNRNEMNDRVNQLSLDTNPNRKNIGVIFADLNGLKKVNDNNGHSAGDVLLKNAARILKDSFPDAEIFRAGGDEFMVLVRDTTEAYLIEKAKEIKEKADATENVRFATGVYFDEDCNNIHNAMKIADGKMYEDKKQFYDKHPELRRPAERL